MRFDVLTVLVHKTLCFVSQHPCAQNHASHSAEIKSIQVPTDDIQYLPDSLSLDPSAGSRSDCEHIKLRTGTVIVLIVHAPLRLLLFTVCVRLCALPLGAVRTINLVRTVPVQFVKLLQKTSH